MIFVPEVQVCELPRSGLTEQINSTELYGQIKFFGKKIRKIKKKQKIKDSPFYVLDLCSALCFNAKVAACQKQFFPKMAGILYCTRHTLLGHTLSGLSTSVENFS